MTLAAKVRLASSIAGIGAHVIWERVAGPTAIRSDEIPRSIETVTRAWLSKALCSEHPGAEVLGFQITGGSDGSTSRRALTVQYNDIGTGAGLPSLLFTKSTPQFTSRLICGPGGALANEAGFYNLLRSRLGIETPKALYAGFDPRSFRSLFIFEDIAATRGCQFVNPKVHIDRAHAQDMVGLMADYHGPYWGNPQLEQLSWLKTSEQFQIGVNEIIAFRERSDIGVERSRKVFPDALYARRSELWPALMRSLALNVRSPLTLQHSDVHIGNWYITGEGRMGLCDWQCMVKGQWACDFSYALASALTIEDRRAWESGLLKLYLERLRSHGVAAPSFDQAWLAYRQQMMHPLFNWIYTIGAGAMQPNMQPDDISLLNIERMTQAIVDLDTLGSLKER